MSSGDILFGVMYFFSGVIWLRRGTRDEVNPTAPISLFALPQLQSDKDRAWKIRTGVLYLMIGAVYLLFAIARHRL